MEYHYKDLINFPNKNFDWTKNPTILQIVSEIPGNWRYVGGCVRDSLLGIFTNDIDINTECKPDEVENALKSLPFKIITIGKKFGTIGVFTSKWKIEITTNRTDIETFGRDATVEFNVSFEEDVKRRDFTINGLMLKNEIIYDLFNGLKDLENKNIKFIGNAENRIEEDYLRILRYIRFYVRYANNNFQYLDLFTKYGNNLKLLSMERIITEIEKICSYDNFFNGLEIINSCNLDLAIFGTKFFYNMDSTFTHFERVALLFSTTNYKKYPLYREITRLLDLTTYEDNLLNIAKIWLNKGEYYAKFFLKFLQKKNNNLKYMDLINKDWILPEYDCTMYAGPQRGKAELYIRYMILNNENLENLYKYL